MSTTTNVMPLVLTKALKSAIEQEGVKAYPNECCGIMIGTEQGGQRIVERLIPVANEFEEGEQYHRFLITPAALMKAEKEAAGKLVLGFYHSHPDHPARPSATDLSLGWPGYLYLIAATTAAGVTDLRAWLFDGGVATAVEVSAGPAIPTAAPGRPA